MSQPPTRTWTSAPDKAGWYWWRWKATVSGNWNMQVICVIDHPNGGLYSAQLGDMKKCWGQFYGPLDSPPQE